MGAVTQFLDDMVMYQSNMLAGSKSEWKWQIAPVHNGSSECHQPSFAMGETTPVCEFAML